MRFLAKFIILFEPSLQVIFEGRSAAHVDQIDRIKDHHTDQRPSNNRMGSEQGHRVVAKKGLDCEKAGDGNQNHGDDKSCRQPRMLFSKCSELLHILSKSRSFFLILGVGNSLKMDISVLK